MTISVLWRHCHAWTPLVGKEITDHLARFLCNQSRITGTEDPHQQASHVCSGQGFLLVTDQGFPDISCKCL